MANRTDLAGLASRLCTAPNSLGTKAWLPSLPAAEHVLFDAVDWRDLVIELPVLAGVLGLQDGLWEPRVT